MTRWKLTGVVATLVILLVPPVYLLRNRAAGPVLQPETVAEFVGTDSYIDCHRQQYNPWQESHHARAMAVATDTTVLGDFDNATFTQFGITSRFYRKGGKFYVYIQGPGGEMADFEVTHTFGWYPLQQYLVPFPGGRLQCLPITWDVKQKKWYHLYPDDPIDPDDCSIGPTPLRIGTACVPNAIPPV